MRSERRSTREHLITVACSLALIAAMILTATQRDPQPPTAAEQILLP